MNKWPAVQVGVALATTSVIALAAATEVTAWKLGWHTSLGDPVAHYGKWPVYLPWSILEWWWWWGLDKVPAIKTGLLAGSAAIAVPVAAALARLAGSGTGRHREFGKAEWGAAADARKAGLMPAKPAGTVLGELGGRLLCYGGDEHQLVAGAAGSGKTTGPVISSLLTWRGSVLVYDPKRELYAQTAAHRSTLGEAWFFDPTSPDSCCFNPLWEIRTGSTHETGDVQNLVSIIIDPDGSKGALDYWDSDAQKLLTGLLLYVLHDLPRDQQTFGKLNELLLDVAGTLEKMATSSHAKCRQIGAYVAALPSKQLSGVHASAAAKLILYDDPIVAEKTSRSDFRISDLVCEDKPASCYLQLRPTDAVRCRPLTRLILTQVAQQLMYDIDAAADGRKKRHQLLYLLEEFPSLGRLDFFSSQMRVMRGYGITALLIVQSFKDIINAYGRDQTIVDNCRIIVAFAASDPDTLKSITTMLGTAIEHKVSETRRRWSMFEVSRSTSEHRRPLLEEGQVRQLPYDEELVLATGTKPFHGKKVRWFAHPQLRCLGTNLRKGGVAPGQNQRFAISVPEAPETVPESIQDRFIEFARALGWSERKLAQAVFPEESLAKARNLVTGRTLFQPEHDAIALEFMKESK
jgi:type IV secretion system protein VirD4